MKLEEINRKLEEISLNIEGLSSLTNEKIEQLAKQVTSLMTMDEGVLFDVSDQISIKDGDKELDFNDIINSNIEKLNSFKREEYFDELNQKDPSNIKENANKAIKKDGKVKELVSAIERMGDMNTIIEEAKKRYSEKDFDRVFETEDLKNKSKIEKENEKIVLMSNFNDEIYEDFNVLDYIKEVEKLEKENLKIVNDITKLENEKNGLPKDLQDVLQKNIDKENAKIENNKKIIKDREAIIGGRTADAVKNDMITKLPKELDNAEVQSALKSENPREAYNNLISKSQNKILKYKNRIDKNEERREKIEIGRAERESLKKAGPSTTKLEYYVLDNDELEAIEEEIENGGDKIEQLIEKAKEKINDPAIYPIPEGKDLRKQVKEWMDSEKGKTRNPFKNMMRMIRAGSEKAQNQYIEAYKEAQIKEEVKSKLIKEKQDEKSKIAKVIKEKESASKMQTLNDRYNSWKKSLFFDVSSLSNDDMKKTKEKGEFGELTAKHYSKVADEQNKEADDGRI